MTRRSSVQRRPAAFVLMGLVLVAVVGLAAASARSLPLAPAQAGPPLCAMRAVTVQLALGQQPTDGPDVILGTDDRDLIGAGGGDDVVCALGGDDIVWGQSGDDLIWGGPGRDVVRGGDGADELRGGDGPDDIAGGRGDDHVYGEAGDDLRLRGGTGDDVVDGGTGDDELIAGNGGEDHVVGGSGDDTLVTGGPRPDSLYGGPGSDVLKGHKGTDKIFGDAGNDALFGGGQLDSLDGGTGVDSCNGGAELATSTGCESESNVVAESATTGRFGSCLYPASGLERVADFAAMRSGGLNPSALNQDVDADGVPTFVRTVFDLDATQMRWGGSGLELEVDTLSTRLTDSNYRAELRETLIDQPIPPGSTQAYCLRFEAIDLPTLHGPVTIFQRFNRDLDGPDIEVELTGANQFAPGEANHLQVVAFDGRHRTGVELDRTNTLLVVIYNDGQSGAYKVVLNGVVLRAASGVSTSGSDQGGWAQFGLYPHGFSGNDGQNTADQIASGATRVVFEYEDFAIAEFAVGSTDLSGFQVIEPAAAD